MITIHSPEDDSLKFWHGVESVVAFDPGPDDAEEYVRDERGHLIPVDPQGLADREGFAALEKQLDIVGDQHDRLKKRVTAVLSDLLKEKSIDTEEFENILGELELDPPAPDPVDVEYTITFRAEVRPASSDVATRLKGKHTARAMLENALTGLATIDLDETVFPDIGRAEVAIASVDVID